MRLRVVALVIVSACVAALAADLEADARRLEGLLMAPCCGANTLAEHDSGQAQRMKQEIRALLASGRNPQEVLDHYVARYGHAILAMPPARGFNLVPYVLPLLALALGPLLLWRKLRGRAPEVEPAALRSGIEARDRERLERELRAW